MPKYNVDLSTWLIVEAESEDEAFAIGVTVIDRIRGEIPELDGEVAGVEDYDE